MRSADLDDGFIRTAIELAGQARRAGNHPFGALLVLDGQVVLTARNTTVLAQHLGSEVERATPEFVRETTGFVIGGVPPLGHVTPVQTLMDEGLLQYDLVWAAAGTPNAVCSASPRQRACLTAVLCVAVPPRPAAGAQDA